ncbi:hypothetical protein EXIGLDRAFT_836828 [Exidia glandulosa HHB12029]|uniref:Transmembrane protein n=1 Tax=Exidia glandulosa HHB12029 TaxID=1314781 RepID=A0A165HEK0_EXIGL|nr:hypothetical protein EXIGLDRAFT_836828 [Exidia glandulosa HHB12029]
MPDPTSQDVVVQDGDPSIAFAPPGDWIPLTNDQEYSGGTLRISWNESATISFSFVGSYFWYFGDLNFDHGRFKISIDNDTGTISTSYNPNGIAVQSLFSQSVDPGPHSVTITNLDNTNATVLDYFAYVDRAAETVQKVTGNHSFTPYTAAVTATSDTIVQADNSSAVTYSNPAQWTVGGSVSSAYHLTYNNGASVSFEFTGEYVWFYADRNFDHGPFLASIDGGAATMFSSYSAVYTDPNALFSRAVSPGHHVLTITNAAAGTGLGVAYFAYRPTNLSANTTPSSSTASSPPALPESSGSSTPTTIPSPNNGGLPIGAIIGIAIGVAVVILLVLTGLFLLRERRRARRQPQPTQGMIYTPQPWGPSPSGVQYGVVQQGEPVEYGLPTYGQSVGSSAPGSTSVSGEPPAPRRKS